MTAQPLFETTRGQLVESVHYGSIAVIDSNGKMIASYGDPQTVAFLRSSAKPFQVLPFVERGGVEHLGFTQHARASRDRPAKEDWHRGKQPDVRQSPAG
jgi:L-asparaginase II